MDGSLEEEQVKPVPVSGQIGQHSPSGMSGLAQSNRGSQYTSSQRTAPLSHTQIRQGSGFQTSLSLYCTPSLMQVPVGTEETTKERKRINEEVEVWLRASHSHRIDEPTKGVYWGESDGSTYRTNIFAESDLESLASLPSSLLLR